MKTLTNLLALYIENPINLKRDLNKQNLNTSNKLYNLYSPVFNPWLNHLSLLYYGSPYFIDSVCTSFCHLDIK